MDFEPDSSCNRDLICLSHLRWGFVFQRPQHLLSRCAATRRVFFVEEAVVVAGVTPRLQIDVVGRVRVVVPQVPEGLTSTRLQEVQRRLLDDLLEMYSIQDFVAWYYTPMALAFTDHWTPKAIVYDCMDELSAFKGAPPGLKRAELRLMRRASLMLTGGHSLFEAKRHAHPNIHSFPSSVDVRHFAKAREVTFDPVDQAPIPHPRLGFIGVIDERMDLALVDGLAAARPDWHIVLVGPVVKIDPASVPRRPNVHSLGPKTYQELPAYLAGWDLCIMPFAHNESTRYISPTKTPEYLASGRQVVSTSIADVVDPYGTAGLVRIADGVRPFVEACAAALDDDAAGRQVRVDAFLKNMSWDDTWARIERLLADATQGAATDGDETVPATRPDDRPPQASAAGRAVVSVSS